MDKYVGSMDVPEATLDRCVKEVAADLYYRKAAPSGITQFATETGMGAQRIARDPMRSIADILRHVLGPAIG